MTATTPANTNQSAEPAQLRHPLDAVVPDPSGMRPLCDEGKFATVLESMVADNAPQIFAVVQEYGDRVDARIAAWGIAFGDRVEVFSVERGMRMSLQSPEQAVFGFNLGSHVRARLVWYNAEACTGVDDDSE